MQLMNMRIEILGIEHAKDNDKDEIFKIKLENAKNIALDRMYPYHKEITELPERLKDWQTRCAIELYNRIGDEGIEKYSENGLSYSYSSEVLSDKLLSELPPPMGEVIK